jgi:hypothetical protein
MIYNWSNDTGLVIYSFNPISEANFTSLNPIFAVHATMFVTIFYFWQKFKIYLEDWNPFYIGISISIRIN